MGSSPPAEPALPHLRPSGIGSLAWALANAAGRPGLRYGVLLVAIAAGLIGSTALLGHAANAPALAAYERNPPCDAFWAPASNCRTLATTVVVDDRPLPLGVHAVTLSTDGRQAVYYGWAEPSHARVLPPGSGALLVAWHGRAARLIGPGLALEPFEGPPGAGLVLIVVAIVCELVCGLALGLQGVLWRLRARVLPPPIGRSGRPGIRSPGGLVFLGAIAAALVAARTGHAAVAAPVHALCGVVMAAQFGAAGLGAVRDLVPAARLGMEALSEEPALRLGGDVVLAAVLVALCLALATDLAVADLLTLPR